MRVTPLRAFIVAEHRQGASPGVLESEMEVDVRVMVAVRAVMVMMVVVVVDMRPRGHDAYGRVVVLFNDHRRRSRHDSGRVAIPLHGVDHPVRDALILEKNEVVGGKPLSDPARVDLRNDHVFAQAGA